MNQLVTIEELNVLKHLVTLGALEDLIVMNRLFMIEHRAGMCEFLMTYITGHWLAT